MNIRNDRREAAIERMAEHLLREGMAGASLRPLAAAAGVSDRMLLYYFADKQELLTATLERVALRVTGELDRALPPGEPLAFAPLLSEVWRALGSPGVRPFMHLWLDLAAGAARGQEPHRTVAGRIADGFLTWAAVRLAVRDESRRAPETARLLATIEGALILDAVGRRETADQAIAAAVG